MSHSRSAIRSKQEAPHHIASFTPRGWLDKGLYSVMNHPLSGLLVRRNVKSLSGISLFMTVHRHKILWRRGYSHHLGMCCHLVNENPFAKILQISDCTTSLWTFIDEHPSPGSLQKGEGQTSARIKFRHRCSGKREIVYDRTPGITTARQAPTWHADKALASLLHTTVSIAINIWCHCWFCSAWDECVELGQNKVFYSK